MKRSERVDLRFTFEEKESLKHQAQEHGMDISSYVRHLINKDALPHSHEQWIEGSLIGNSLFNSLLLNPGLSLKCKQAISREVEKYV